MSLGRRQVAEILALHGLAPSRALGQNFLVDANVARRIARLSGVGAGDAVVEIGAGLGALTLALAATGASVTALEIDRHLIPLLRESVGGTEVRVVQGDALRLDWDALLKGASSWVVVANLPYNVATPLLLLLLEGAPRVRRLVVMVQTEVAQRLVAAPGGRAYGAVSVRVAYWAQAAVLARVGPAVFLPRPKVGSTLVELRRLDSPALGPEVDYGELVRLVRAGFGQRRKMLRRSLEGTVEAGDLRAVGIRPEARAEELDLEAWGRLVAWRSSGTPPRPS